MKALAVTKVETWFMSVEEQVKGGLSTKTRKHTYICYYTAASEYDSLVVGAVGEEPDKFQFFIAPDKMLADFMALRNLWMRKHEGENTIKVPAESPIAQAIAEKMKTAEAPASDLEDASV